MSTIFTASVMQPLLRGSERTVVVERLTQAERDTLYRIRTFNRFRKTFVVWVITQYYRALDLVELGEGSGYYEDTPPESRQVNVLDAVYHYDLSGRLLSIEQDEIKSYTSHGDVRFLPTRIIYTKCI